MNGNNFLSVMKAFTVLWAMLAAACVLFAVLMPSTNQWIVAGVVVSILVALVAVLRNAAKQLPPKTTSN